MKRIYVGVHEAELVTGNGFLFILKQRFLDFTLNKVKNFVISENSQGL